MSTIEQRPVSEVPKVDYAKLNENNQDHIAKVAQQIQIGATLVLGQALEHDTGLLLRDEQGKGHDVLSRAAKGFIVINGVLGWQNWTSYQNYLSGAYYADNMSATANSKPSELTTFRLSADEKTRLLKIHGRITPQMLRALAQEHAAKTEEEGIIHETYGYSARQINTRLGLYCGVTGIDPIKRFELDLLRGLVISGKTNRKRLKNMLVEDLMHVKQ